MNPLIRQAELELCPGDVPQRVLAPRLIVRGVVVDPVRLLQPTVAEDEPLDLVLFERVPVATLISAV